MLDPGRSAKIRNVCRRRAVHGPHNHHWIFPQAARVVCRVEQPQRSDVQIHIVAGCETPAVVGSTTIMSTPVAAGELALNAMVEVPVPGAATINETLFDLCPFGFCSARLRFLAFACR